MKYPASVLAAALLMVPAAKAEVYLTPFMGYSFAASEFNASKTGLDTTGKVSFDESANYGVILGTPTNHPGNMYVLYSRQSTDLLAGGDFSDERVTSLSIDYAHIGGSLYFPKGDLMPYITASLGLTQMSPGDSLSDETRFSMGFGAGTEYRVSKHVALVGELRAFATFIDSEHDLFCDTSNCLWRVEADVFWQGQANLGVSIRF